MFNKTDSLIVHRGKNEQRTSIKFCERAKNEHKPTKHRSKNEQRTSKERAKNEQRMSKETTKLDPLTISCIMALK